MKSIVKSFGLTFSVAKQNNKFSTNFIHKYLSYLRFVFTNCQSEERLLKRRYYKMISRSVMEKKIEN